MGDEDRPRKRNRRAFSAVHRLPKLKTKERALRVVIIWLAILCLAGFAYAFHSTSDPVNLTVIPEVPRPGEPVLIKYEFNNTGPRSVPVTYDLFIDDQKAKSGTAVLDPFSTKQYSYVYLSNLELGNQSHFALRASLPDGSYERSVSLPAYPPHVWSSFVSMAALTSSEMGNLSSMDYYRETLFNDRRTQVGIVMGLVLLALLVFREVNRPPEYGNTVNTLVSLRFAFATLTIILLIIFASMVFTRVAMILQ